MGQACDSGHLRDIEEILEIVRLIDEETVNAQLLEIQRVVLLLLGGKKLESGFEPKLGLLQLFHELGKTSVATLLKNQILQFVELLLQQILLSLTRHRNALETGMGDDHRIPITGGDTGKKLGATGGLEIFLACDQDVGAGIERQ